MILTVNEQIEFIKETTIIVQSLLQQGNLPCAIIAINTEKQSITISNFPGVMDAEFIKSLVSIAFDSLMKNHDLQAKITDLSDIIEN